MTNSSCILVHRITSYCFCSLHRARVLHAALAGLPSTPGRLGYLGGKSLVDRKGSDLAVFPKMASKGSFFLRKGWQRFEDQADGYGQSAEEHMFFIIKRIFSRRASY